MSAIRICLLSGRFVAVTQGRNLQHYVTLRAGFGKERIN